MKLTIGVRILTGLGIVEALALGLGLFLLSKMVALREVESAIKARDLAVLEAHSEVSHKQRDLAALRERTVAMYALRKVALPEGTASVKGDPARAREQWEKGHEEMSAALRALKDTSAGYAHAPLSAARQQQWEAIARNAEETEEARKSLHASADAMFDLLAQEKYDQLAGPLRETAERRRVFDRGLEAGVQLTRRSIEIGTELSAQTYQGTWMSAAIGLALMLALGLAAGVTIQRSITVPLGRFMQFVERVGKGDLTGKAPETGVADLRKLGDSLDGMVGGLKALAGQINGATANLQGAAREILAAVQETAAGARQQAASVQQITVTVDEVSQSGGQISERAKQVASAAEAAASSTSVGLRAVQQATRSMASIREQVEAFAEHIVALTEKTQAVGEIISAATDIAERSNLLALNAAIEAAGAGEHGQRFAVVAGEMKSLADQAKESTVQVQSILGGVQKGINSSVMLTEEAVKRAEAGREQAETTERVIREMADTTQQSVHAFQQIIAATNQQQIGLEQVTQGMRDIRQAASQTATATSQLEAAVTNINTLSKQLQDATGRYRL